jgi:GT2 family glycosyltransferase
VTLADSQMLSVVIAARNVRAELGAQLDTLLAQDCPVPCEIVVVDNASTDGTEALVEDYARRDARVRLVRAPHVRGAAAVRNAGASAARGTAIAFCDADDIVGPRWLTAMGTALAEQAAVTGPLDVTSVNPAWLVRTRGEPPRTAPASFHGLFPLLPAGNSGIQRALFDAVGGFDPDVVANEDADLSLRVFRAGIAVHFAPDALVHYRYRAGARELFRQGFTYGTYRPLVARRARAEGFTVPRFAGWKSWATLVRWLVRLRSAEGRASWMWVAGVRLGLLRGCLRYRTLYL